MSGRNSKLEVSVHATKSVERSLSNLSNTFNFWNGDEYTGLFYFCKEKQKLTRRGKGVYKTGDGQIYEGTWENDTLNGPSKITFPNQTVFTGNLKDMQLHGLGTFSFKGNVRIEGDFVENKLMGRVFLKDPNDNIWKGIMSLDDSYVSFYPSHAFWQSIPHIKVVDSHMHFDDADEEVENTSEEFY